MTRKASTAQIAGLEDRIAEFAARCISICDLLPRGRAGASNFKDQLARSATSVAANYAEATVPSSQRDFSGRLTIALKELAESRMHLCIISRLGYRRSLTRDFLDSLVNEADAIAKILKGAFSVKRRPRKKPADGEDSSNAKIADILAESDIKPKKKPGRKKKKPAKKPVADGSGEEKKPPKKRKTTRKRKAPRKRKTTRKRTTASSAASKRRTITRKRTANGRFASEKPPVSAASRQVLLPVFSPPCALPPPPTHPLLPLHPSTPPL